MISNDENNLLSRKRKLCPLMSGSRSIENYQYLNKIDEGAYGVVYRAKDCDTGEIVAIKKVKLGKEKEGFPITSIREINILLNLNHPNIIKTKEVVYGNSLDKIFSVLEYMDYELKALISDKKYVFNLSHIKCLMQQLLLGTEYMHSKWIIHRDLKTSNLLMNNKGVLKIGDYGLARKFGSPLKPYTQLVVTLWYRAPELLLNTTKYDYKIDIWSIGCIFAEMIFREPIFQGVDELDQLNKIFKLMGTPTEEIWPGWSELPNSKKINFKKYNENKLKEKFIGTEIPLSDYGFDLLSKLLNYDPKKRIKAKDALEHPWFKEEPLPCNTKDMPIFPELNDKEREIMKKNRKKSLDEKQRIQRENLLENDERFDKQIDDVDYEKLK